MPTPNPIILDIVSEALKFANPTDRAIYLDRVCRGDVALRRQVDSLLAAQSGMETIQAAAPSPPEPPSTPEKTDLIEPAQATLDLPGSSSPHPGPLTADPGNSGGGSGDRFLARDQATVEPRTSSREIPFGTDTSLGEVIAGRYTLIKVIGEGGMGSVYLASQNEPVKRQVALKLIKTGMDSKAVVARFDAERQALALMDHPNIARIYDGGMTERGQPFFVMELVKGVPLTDYCDAHRLTLDARLALFVAVCQAVQHAHQKGIIHRDLKPANVLVTEVDGRPTPKVIDFGVAKATEVPLTDQSFADTGAIVGTPAYMSPEQADPSSMDIDTRTDVYALGVILYELLTGSPPIDEKQFKRGAILEMLRMVREVDPPRPSTKLSTAEGLPNIAANRGIEPPRLAKLVEGELDWVVMKALEKDRARRYDTANGLARDIQRYLADEVVEARPPSRAYRLKKFVKRNKVQVIAAGLVLLALVGGVIGTGIGFLEASRARDAETLRANAEEREKERATKAEAEAREQKNKAEENAKEARRQEDEAKQQLALANALTDFLRNDLLGQAGTTNQANRFFAPKPNLTVREALDRAAAGVGAKFADNPLLEASIRHTLGEAYIQVSEQDLATNQLSRALELRNRWLGPENPETTRTLNLLGKAHIDAGHPEKAVQCYTQLREIGEKQYGRGSEETESAIHNLALAYHSAGMTKKAIELFEGIGEQRRKKYGENDSSYLSTLGSLASAYKSDNQNEKAIELYEKARDGYLKTKGLDHPDVILLMNNLAGAYESVGRHGDALLLFQDQVKRADKNLGPDHAQSLMSRHNLAHALLEQNRVEEALPVFEDLLPLVEKKLGPDHKGTLTIQHNLARAYMGAGREEEAIALILKVANRRKATIGIDHPDTIHAFKHYGFFNWLTKKFDKGAEGFAQSLEGSRKHYGERREETIATAFNLAFNLRDSGQIDKAKEVLDEWIPHALAITWKDRGMFLAGLNYAIALNFQKNQAEANRPLVGRLKTEVLKNPEKDPLKHAGNLASVSLSLMGSKLYDEAEPLLRESLAIRTKAQPNAWTTFNTESMLGGALLGQKKYAEAGPFLHQGYEGLKAREKSIPAPVKARLPEAIDRLVEWSIATEKPEEIKKWQEERAKYPAPPPPARKP